MTIMICTIVGVSKDDIRRMIEYLYGVCVWETLPSGEVVCYPTSTGKVSINRQGTQQVDSPDAGNKPFTDEGCDSETPTSFSC